MGARHGGTLAVRVVAVLSAAMLLVSCGSHREVLERADLELWDSLTTPVVHDFPDAGAIILLDEGSMETFGAGETGFSVFERHKIVRILNERGHRYANIVIPYNSQIVVGDIEARTISPRGVVTHVDPREVFDASLYPNFVFFSDQRAKLFTMPRVEDGAIVELRYRLTLNDRAFWHAWDFQDDAPTARSAFTLVKPSEWEMNYRSYGISIEPAITKGPPGFKSTYVWEVRDMPPRRWEFAMPPRSETTARLAIAPRGFGDWKDVARWYDGIVSNKVTAGPGVTKLAAELSAGATSEGEKLWRIFDWVQRRVRYMAVEIGIGGYTPHSAEEVCEKEYGDCKDMTVLLCALGREVGIDVNLVLLGTRQNGLIDTLLPSPLQFNHAIAFAPSVGTGGTWMDATEKGMPFGRLPWYDRGVVGLVIRDGAPGEIRMTPQDSVSANRTAMSWDCWLNPTGAGSIRGRSVLWGDPAMELRNSLFLLPADGHRQWLETYLAKECPGALLDSFMIEGLSPAADSLTVSYAFRVASLGAHRPDGIVLRPGVIGSSDLADYFRSKDRVYPVRFRFGSHTSVTLDLHLPETMAFSGTEFQDSLRSPFGSADWKWSGTGRHMRIENQRSLAGRDVVPPEHERFRDFLDAMRRNDAREVIARGGAQ